MNEQPASVDLEHVLSVCPAIIYATKASGDFPCTFVSENINQILGFTQQDSKQDDTTSPHVTNATALLSDMSENLQ